MLHTTSLNFPPATYEWGNYQGLSKTEYVEGRPSRLTPDDFSVLDWNILQPSEDEAATEAKTTEDFEAWAAGGFKNGDLFLKPETFATFGEADFTRTVDKYTERTLAQAVQDDPQATQRVLQRLEQKYLRAIGQVDAYSKQETHPDATMKRLTHFINALLAKIEDLEKIWIHLAQMEPVSLAQKAKQSLGRETVPHQAWEVREAFLVKSLENYLEHVGDAPYVVMLQETTPRVLDLLCKDLGQKHAFSCISREYAAGQPTPKPTSGLQTPGMSLTLLVSDKFRVIADWTAPLPLTELGQQAPPRRALGAILEEKLTKKQFAVLTTHTDYRVSLLEYAKTAAAIHDMVIELHTKYPGLPIVFGGDMNMFPTIPAAQQYYEALRRDFPVDFRDKQLYTPKELGKLSFLDVPSPERNGDPGPFAPRILSQREDASEANALDQLLASGVELRYGARHVGVWDPETKDLASLDPADRERYMELCRKGYYPSDHLGSEIVFRLP